MFRSLLFSALVLGALALLVPLLPKATLPASGSEKTLLLDEPDVPLDVDSLRRLTRGRALKFAADQELARLRTTTLSKLITQARDGDDRERSLAVNLLGISGQKDAIPTLIRAFELEQDRRMIATLALALAETRRTDAIEALIQAIRNRDGIRAYEACKALKDTFGHTLGLDADKWERWLQATTATRD